MIFHCHIIFDWNVRLLSLFHVTTLHRLKRICICVNVYKRNFIHCMLFILLHMWKCREREKNEENNFIHGGFLFIFKKKELMMQNTTSSNYILWKGCRNASLMQTLALKKSEIKLHHSEKKGWKLCHKTSLQRTHIFFLLTHTRKKNIRDE